MTSPHERRHAPGGPGAEPHWSASRKRGAGTAVNSQSPLWFTTAQGILNELYFPTLDHANTRTAGFLVAADPDFFSAEQHHTHHAEEPLEQGAPAYRLINTCVRGRYRITKEILTDPLRPTLLMRVAFEPLRGALDDYRLYFHLAPHLANQGAGNTARVDSYKGVPLLAAQRGNAALAVACSAGWKARSCGYLGTSDGYRDVETHFRLTACFDDAPDGNVTLTGEIDLVASRGNFVLAIGFGDTGATASHMARASLLADFDGKRAEYLAGWRAVQENCLPLVAPTRQAFDVYRVSTAVLRTHESKQFPGAIIASLSIPWGERRGDHDLDAYHFVWPRDQVRAAVGFLAAGLAASARAALFHLMCTQDEVGSWPQNMWVNGVAHRHASQSDQAAGFILLAGLLRRRDSWGEVDPWPSLRRAAEFLLRSGAVSGQDRWEESRGYTPFTLAAVIAALVEFGHLAQERSENTLAHQCLSTADAWHESVDSWLYVTDTPLAARVGVEGYYVRLAPPGVSSPDDLRHATVQLNNYDPPEAGRFRAAEIVSPDALALVRFGLRRADDPRIANTVRVIDATLRRETKSGPVWRRFTHDAYGEPEDGSPFAHRNGIGRGWPLLTGERAHYELARGNRAEAERLMHAMVAQSHHGGLLPEQIWDAEDIPDRELFNGQPTGSAMPLVWAHAEFVTLLRSLRDGAVFDCPPEVASRYAHSTAPGERPPP